MTALLLTTLALIALAFAAQILALAAQILMIIGDVIFFLIVCALVLCAEAADLFDRLKGRRPRLTTHGPPQ